MTPRRTLLLCARLVMEGAWLTALVAFCSLITGGHQSAMPGLAVFGLLFLAFGVAYVLQNLEITETKLRLWGMLLAVAAINGVARFLVTGELDFWNLAWPFSYLGGGAGTPEQGRQTVLALALGVVLWWRGARIAEDIPNFGSVLISFRAGVIFVAFQSILEGLVPMSDGASGMTVPFFVGGLSALSLAHLERVDRHYAIKLSGYGVAVPFGAIGGIGILGLFLGLMPFGELGRVIAKLGEVVNLATSFVFVVILLALGYVAEIVIVAMRWLLSFVQVPQSMRLPLEQMDQSLLERLREEGLQAGIPALFMDIARAAVLLVFLLLALTILARAFRRRRDEADLGLSEEHLPIDGDLAGQSRVPVWLQRLFSGLTGRNLPDLTAGLMGVFRLYFRMLQWAARSGVSRQPWRTPLEFQSDLEEAFGAHNGAIARITRAFVAARYGRRTPPAEEIHRLESDLQQLSAQDRIATTLEGVPPS